VVRSFGPAREGVQIELARGLVDPDQRIHRWTLRGTLDNCDTRVRLMA